MNELTTWELVNPLGTVKVEAFNLNRHPETLEGKNVLLRWNGKHNGDIFLDRIAELLTANIKGVKAIKSWEVVHDTARMTSNPDVSKELAKKLADLKPDIAIGCQRVPPPGGRGVALAHVDDVHKHGWIEIDVLRQFFYHPPAFRRYLCV